VGARTAKDKLAIGFSCGQHQGRQLLSATKLAEALYKTNVMGLPYGRKNRFGEARYHLSFWSAPYRTTHGCFFQIPWMSGAGGNLVVLLPNGISAFRFADGLNYDVDTMVLAGEAVRPFPCQSGSGEAPPRERQPLSASDLHAELPGNTFYREPMYALPAIYDVHLNLFAVADGMLYGTLDGGLRDAGRWHITSDGQVCWQWWSTRREECFTIYRKGETFELYPQDGLGKVVFRRQPGNPEGY
jgi:hypothetical protein